VVVTAETTAVDTQTIQLATTIQSKQLQELPLAGNRYFALVGLSPGVIPADQGYGVNVSPNYNYLGNDPQSLGSRFNTADYQLDSSHYRNAEWGNSSNTPSSHAVDQVQVIRNNFSAEYGLTSAMVVSAAIKSGTNRLHGDFYETWGNDALNTRTFLDGAHKLPVRYNQFGASVGGPVYIPKLYNGKDRTFFFFNYEGIRVPGSIRITSPPLPTAAERGGDFSALTQTLIDPNTNKPFATRNLIPSSEFDPVGKFVMDSIPAANSTDASGNPINKTNLAAGSSENQYSIRVDQNFGEKSRLFGRFFRDTPSSIQYSSSVVVPFYGSYPQQVTNRDLAVNYFYNFKPNLVNQVTVGYNRTPQVTSNGGAKLDWSSAAAGGGIKGWTGADRSVGLLLEGGNFIIQPGLIAETGTRAFQVTDTLSWIHGRNTTKFGGSYQRWRGIASSGPNLSGEVFGSFFINGTHTGNAFADLLMGQTDSLVKTDYPTFDAVMTNYEWYVQNDMKVNRKLTVNLGLRYRILLPYAQDNGQVSTFVPGEQSTKFPSAPTGLVFPGDRGIPRYEYNINYHDFSPRVGFAFDPTGTGKTSIRAGFGIYYDLPPFEFAWYQAGNSPYGLGVSIQNAILSDPYRTYPGGNPFPYKFNPAKVTFTTPITYDSFIDPHTKSGYVQQWNLTLQHQLRGVLVEASYVGKAGDHLLGTTMGNPARYIPGTDAQGNPLSTSGNVDSRRIYAPNFGIMWYQTGLNRSSYHALELSARGNATRSLLLTVAWTYGHSIDDNSSPRYDTTAGGDPFNRRLDKGSSDFDIRHLGTASAVWTLPALTGSSALLRGVAGGWVLTSLFRAQSGLPGTLYDAQDPSLTGNYTPGDRADLVDPNHIYAPHPTRDAAYRQWINPAAFAAPKIGTFGNSGRNIIRGPGQWVDDFSLAKNFRLRESVLLKFRADAYNAFNHTRIGACTGGFSFGWAGVACGMVQDVTVTGFGGYAANSAITSGRTIQLGMQIQY
jgi:hypothetical protein